MGALLGAVLVPVLQAVEVVNSQSTVTSAVKVLGGAAFGVTAIALGAIGGGYFGATRLGQMTENYYKKNGDPNKLGSLNIGISVVTGGVGGALAGGFVATAFTIHTLGLL